MGFLSLRSICFPNREMPLPASRIMCRSENDNPTHEVASPYLADVISPDGNPPRVPQKMSLSSVSFTLNYPKVLKTILRSYFYLILLHRIKHNQIVDNEEENYFKFVSE